MSESPHLPDRLGRLRDVIDAACDETDGTLNDMTVLSARNDPFRVDTPAGHRVGAWLAAEVDRLGLGDRSIHLRGLHYALKEAGSVKPDGTPYTNTDEDWEWLQSTVAKAARWLGYIRFERIKDARSAVPVIRRIERFDPAPYIDAGIEVEIPDADELEPRVWVFGFEGEQPYKLVLFGEKASLEDVLAPIAEEFSADLYLPAGEISDTFLHTIAAVGAEDGRPMVVLTVSDCDPAGWQMPISIGRKLQAFQALKFPDLEFEVHRVALTPDLVRAHDLPMSPLKEKEKRAGKWKQAMGVEQTEIDALLVLKPHLLDRLVRHAITPFYDATLDDRVRAAKQAWEDEAQERLNEQLDPDQLDRIQADAEKKIDTVRVQIDEINKALQIDVGDVLLPEIRIPEPELDETSNDEPLINSRWPWIDQTESLKRSKDYTE